MSTANLHVSLFFIHFNVNDVSCIYQLPLNANDDDDALTVWSVVTLDLHVSRFKPSGAARMNLYIHITLEPRKTCICSGPTLDMD